MADRVSSEKSETIYLGARELVIDQLWGNAFPAVLRLCIDLAAIAGLSREQWLAVAADGWDLDASLDDEELTAPGGDA
jgi:hypothetical protein